MGRTAATALLEIRLNLLTPAPWIVGLILAAFGYLAVRTAPDASSFPLAWVLSYEIGPLTVVLLLFLAAALANRPQRYDVTELLDSKVVGSEELIFGRWVGMVAAVMVPLGIQYGVTMLGQVIHAKPAVLPLAYFLSLVRLMPAVLFFTTLAFCLVTVTRVLVLGAGLAALLWFALYAGTTYYPTVFRIELSQNAGVYLGLTATVLAAMLLGYRGRRRAKRAPVTYALGAGAVLLFLITAVGAAWLSLAMPGKARAAEDWRRLRGARREQSDPLPNFAWVDLQGRRVSLAELRGRHALLVFFQPRDGGLLPLLGRLGELRKEFAAEKLEVIGVCLSEDLNAARHAVRVAGADLPVVAEWGKPIGDQFEPEKPASVAAWALRVAGTPLSVVVDPQGKEIRRGLPLDEKGWSDLKKRLRAAIKGEPDPVESLPEGLPQELMQRMRL
jgi:hypothetical protein